jgi:hypothetical protein
MTELTAEYAKESDRTQLQADLQTELATLHNGLPRLLTAEPKRFTGVTETPIQNITSQEARLLLNAIRVIREGLEATENSTTALPEKIRAGLAVIAGSKFEEKAVRDDLGIVTDTTRTSVEQLLRV